MCLSTSRQKIAIDADGRVQNPTELKAANRSLGWKSIDGKKVPCGVRTGAAVNPTDPSFWSRFEEAVAAQSQYGLTDIGFALRSGRYRDLIGGRPR